MDKVNFLLIKSEIISAKSYEEIHKHFQLPLQLFSNHIKFTKGLGYLFGRKEDIILIGVLQNSSWFDANITSQNLSELELQICKLDPESSILSFWTNSNIAGYYYRLIKASNFRKSFEGNDGSDDFLIFGNDFSDFEKELLSTRKLYDDEEAIFYYSTQLKEYLPHYSLGGSLITNILATEFNIDYWELENEFHFDHYLLPIEMEKLKRLGLL
ncbi:hypothetical protein [Chondrinema litorale]|uniref:hypothetical protein n=1 Tax=Chondrinema litorale TaxID=2994555 RepID=UPI00254334BF|nr:hypothetical protein [Chondrinema litorale]UZR97656.1 hypothetical protein OQ292_28025 [Chondrinema litorale]